MNVVILTGRLTADPELRYTPQGDGLHIIQFGGRPGQPGR